MYYSHLCVCVCVCMRVYIHIYIYIYSNLDHCGHWNVLDIEHSVFSRILIFLSLLEGKKLASLCLSSLKHLLLNKLVWFYSFGENLLSFVVSRKKPNQILQSFRRNTSQIVPLGDNTSQILCPIKATQVKLFCPLEATQVRFLCQSLVSHRGNWSQMLLSLRGNHS